MRSLRGLKLSLGVRRALASQPIVEYPHIEDVQMRQGYYTFIWINWTPLCGSEYIDECNNSIMGMARFFGYPFHPGHEVSCIEVPMTQAKSLHESIIDRCRIEAFSMELVDMYAHMLFKKKVN